MVFGGVVSVRMHVALAAAVISIALYVYMLHREIRKIDQRVSNIDAAIYQRLIEASTYSMQAARDDADADDNDVHDLNDFKQPNQLKPIKDDNKATHDESSSTCSEDIRAMMAKIDASDDDDANDDDCISDVEDVNEDVNEDLNENVNEDVNDVKNDNDDNDVKNDNDDNDVKNNNDHNDVKNNNDDNDVNNDNDDNDDNDVNDDAHTISVNVETVGSPPAESVTTPTTQSISTPKFAEYKLKALKLDELKAILRNDFDVDAPRGNKKDLVNTILELQHRSL